MAQFDYHFDEAYELAHLDDTELTEVELDGMVIMKIIKHCRENLPQLVTGQLLGADFSTSLQVTDCVPFPKIDDEDDGSDGSNEGSSLELDESDAKGTEYQLEMMRCLREVNVDNNVAGWYSSSFMESYLSKFTITTQYKYQERIKKSVLITYDPLRTSQGILAIKALRLTQVFMDILKAGAFTKDTLKGVSFEDVFEEIPIRIHNNSLANAFLHDLSERSSMDCDHEKLDLSTNPFLERNLEFMIDSMDELGAEQAKIRYFQNNQARQQAQQAAWLSKRRAENAARKKNGEELLPETDPSNPIFKPIPEPSRLESLLLFNQINNYCKQTNEFSGNAFAKLYLFGELEK
eukprot:TRINITY_DN1313_c0_g1_i1.p1 TRINITY_DN1313_c0_g1~~TRINITY_DN1313_c0_g1_i1.p1  ORF type:complete len:366 (-),score=103.06 TRINITY_DN1313_c0_g1_i1:65-1111(-)